jgi:uncharacterized protein (UPF0548 family)
MAASMESSPAHSSNFLKSALGRLSEGIAQSRYSTLVGMGDSKLQDALGTLLDLLRFLGDGLRSVAPIIGILLVFQLVVLRQPLENWRERSPSDWSEPLWELVGTVGWLLCERPS